MVKNKKLVNIRYDLFAIKQWDSSLNSWVVVMMTTDRKFAYEQLPQYQTASLGFFTKAKVVHPSQFTVEAFRLVGNRIWHRVINGPGMTSD